MADPQQSGGGHSKLIGFLEIAAGAIGAAFTGGATLPLIGAGINTIAAGSARDQQQQAAQQANTQLQNNYGQLTDLYRPYTSLGAGASQQLAQGLGIQLPTMTAPAPSSSTAAATPLAPGAGQFAAAPWQVASGVTGQVPADGGRSLSSVLGPIVQRQSSYGPQTVRMQGPDGSMREVPAYQVPFFKQRGAKEV